MTSPLTPAGIVIPDSIDVPDHIEATIHEEAYIEASELVSPNSEEFDGLLDRLIEQATEKALNDMCTSDS